MTYDDKEIEIRINEAEQKGRVIIKNLVDGRCERYEFTTDPHDHIDLYLTGFTDMAAIEIKDRENYTADQVESFGGQYIMKHKFISLMQAAKLGYRPIFIAIFKDRIMMWDLTDMTFEWKKKKLDRLNVADVGKKEYWQSELHLKDAIKEYETERYRTVG